MDSDKSPGNAAAAASAALAESGHDGARFKEVFLRNMELDLAFFFHAPKSQDDTFQTWPYFLGAAAALGAADSKVYPTYSSRSPIETFH